MTNSSQAGPAIALAGVNLSLGQGAARVHILKDIDLHIGSGEAIGLVGPSGSGKSTLLMVMAGLERADSGNVTVAGENLGALDEDALARPLGGRGREMPHDWPSRPSFRHQSRNRSCAGAGKSRFSVQPPSFPGRRRIQGEPRLNRPMVRVASQVPSR